MENRTIPVRTRKETRHVMPRASVALANVAPPIRGRSADLPLQAQRLRMALAGVGCERLLGGYTLRRDVLKHD